MAISAAAIRAGQAYVELSIRNLMSRQLPKLTADFRRWAANIQQIGFEALSFGGALLTPAGLGLRAFAQFDDQMRIVQAVTGATAEQMEMMTDRARELGRETSWTATQIAEGMVALGRGGFDPTQVQESITAVQNLARATQVDLGLAGNAVVKTLNQFGLEASDATRVADALTVTVNNSTQTMVELADGLRYAGTLANLAGTDLEETLAILGALADAGLDASVAGTQLARAWKNLATETNRGELQALTGIESFDAEGNLRPLVDIARELGEVMQGMGTGERLAVLETVFGRGAAGMAALIRAAQDSESSFARLTDRLQDTTGEANRVARQMDAGIGGAWRRFVSTVTDLGLEIGDIIATAILPYMDHVRALIQVFQSWAEEHQGVILAITGLGAAMVAFGTAALAASFALKGFAMMLAVLRAPLFLSIGLVKALGAAMVFLTTPAGIVVASFTALAAAILLFTGKLHAARDAVADLAGKISNDLKNAFQGIDDAIANNNVELAWTILTKTIELIWARMTLRIQKVWLQTIQWIADKILLLRKYTPNAVFLRDFFEASRETLAEDTRAGINARVAAVNELVMELRELTQQAKEAREELEKPPREMKMGPENYQHPDFPDKQAETVQQLLEGEVEGAFNARTVGMLDRMMDGIDTSIEEEQLEVMEGMADDIAFIRSEGQEGGLAFT